MKAGPVYTSVAGYIAAQPLSARAGLTLLRETIRKAAPKAEETISYNMPAYRQYGVLVYFAVAKTHFGFYPTSGPINAFREKLSSYKTSKGAIQFPLDEPLPVKLITAIVKWRIKEDLEREALRREKQRKPAPRKSI